MEVPTPVDNDLMAHVGDGDAAGAPIKPIRSLYAGAALAKHHHLICRPRNNADSNKSPMDAQKKGATREKIEPSTVAHAGREPASTANWSTQQAPRGS